MADQIDKGAQGTRLTGIVDSAYQIRGTNERPETMRTVICTDVYSKGNLSGSMMYMFPMNGSFARVTSGKMAETLRHVANTFEQQREVA